MSNFLYNNVDDDVREELDARSTAMGSVNRTTAHHEWVNQKVAYAKVSNHEREVTMAPPAEGGFDDFYTDKTRYVPNPVLTGVSISNEGRMGSLQKATINFTLFNREQLDEYELTFMTPGEELTIDYGWSVSASGSDKSSDTFVGLVYNFAWNLTNFGGFECSVDVVGKGFKILGLITGANTKDPLIDNDQSGEKRNYSGLMGTVNWVLVNTLMANDDAHAGDLVNGMCFFQLKLAQVEDNEFQEKRTYYVTLGRFTEIVNEYIELVLGEPNPIPYVCNNEVTISQYDGNIFSANPAKIILPDESCGKYAGEDALKTAATFSNGEIANLNNILLEISWLDELHATTMAKKTDESPDISINTFFNAIFEQISLNTGGIYNLSLIGPQEDEPKLYIIDTNYTNSVDEILPYIFAAFEADSILRDLSVDSKLPDKMATSMYIAGRGSDGTGINSDVATNITGTPLIEDTSTGPDPLDILMDTNNRLGRSGFELEAVREAEDALRKYKIFANAKNWNEDVLYPIGLNISMDGVAGFRFGNVIGTNWLPAKYRDKAEGLKIIFVVTRVTHEISSNDWVTSLETQCRMKL